MKDAPPHFHAQPPAHADLVATLNMLEALLIHAVSADSSTIAQASRHSCLELAHRLACEAISHVNSIKK